MDLAPDLQLPSIPEVTLRALEACQQEESYRTISEIVSVDTALVARVLALVNSPLYRPEAPSNLSSRLCSDSVSAASIPCS